MMNLMNLMNLMTLPHTHARAPPPFPTLSCLLLHNCTHPALLEGTAGAKRVTRRIEFEIAVAMKELQHVQELNKSKQKEGASSAPMGKQKQIIDKLKKNLDSTKKKITVGRSDWVEKSFVVL